MNFPHNFELWSETILTKNQKSIVQLRLSPVHNANNGHKDSSSLKIWDKKQNWFFESHIKMKYYSYYHNVTSLTQGKKPIPLKLCTFEATRQAAKLK